MGSVAWARSAPSWSASCLRPKATSSWRLSHQLRQRPRNRSLHGVGRRRTQGRRGAVFQVSASDSTKGESSALRASQAQSSCPPTGTRTAATLWKAYMHHTSLSQQKLLLNEPSPCFSRRKHAAACRLIEPSRRCEADPPTM